MFVTIHDPRNVWYAILSHTWAETEQTYEDIRKLQASASGGGSTHTAGADNLNGSHTLMPPREASAPSILTHCDLSEKIAGACRVARVAGYKLLWVDACCIDKSSSAELSEAINSMYLWYSIADICLVYLADVPDDDDILAWGSRFRSSRWHTRSWTLQELIAPRRVVFLSRRWRWRILLKEITEVDAPILTGVASLDSVSVARRMSWASRRNATRVEDKAYSLLGIFGVYLSPIYGEGSNAFIRLQEEIIRTIPDQSIFATSRGMPPFSSTPNSAGIRPSLDSSSPKVDRTSGSCDLFYTPNSRSSVIRMASYGRPSWSSLSSSRSRIPMCSSFKAECAAPAEPSV
ncbi:HET-domain-containing protein [Pilatotrama ljubarskyi]|nr:HET-domain-containing protein [Pilatotrama ljubarskyi]